MITWNIQTPTLVRIGNPVLFYFNTDNLYDNVGGNYSQIFVQCFGFPTIGATASFKIDRTQFIFTFASSPNDSGTELPTRPALMPIVTYLNNLKASFEKNYYLFTHYEISVVNIFGQDGILFYARETGSKFDWTDILGTSLTIGCTGAVDLVKRENFNIISQLWLFDNDISEFFLAGEEHIRPDNNGDCRFNLAEYFRPWMRSKMTFLPAGSVHFLHKELFRRFFVRYGEAFGSSMVVQGMNFTTNMSAVPGKIPDHQFEENYRTQYPANWTTFRTVFNRLDQFLTNQPNPKAVRRISQERLYLPISGPFLKYFKIFYSNGSTHQFSVPVGGTNTGLYEFLVDVHRNGLENLNPGLNITKYQFWVMNDDATEYLSDIREFIIDNRKYRHQRQFVFINEKGGWDTIWMTGRQQVGHTVIRDSVIEGPAVENPFIRRKKTDLVQRINESVEAATGHFPESDLDWVHELVNSDEVYEVIGNTFFPINITGQDFKKRNDGEFVYDVIIEYDRDLTKLPKGTELILEDTMITLHPMWSFNANPDLSFSTGGIRFQPSAGNVATIYKLAHWLFTTGYTYEVEYEMESYDPQLWKITPKFYNHLSGEQVTLQNGKKRFKQKVVGQDTAFMEFSLRIEGALPNPGNYSIRLTYFAVRLCYE